MNDPAIKLPPLSKPLTTSKFWDGGIDWPLAGERAARLEREAQLSLALELLREFEAIIFKHVVVDVVMEGPRPYLKNKSILPVALHELNVKLDASGLLGEIGGRG